MLWLQLLLLLLVPTLLDQHSTLTKWQINHVDIRYPYTLLLSPHLNTLERLKLFNALLRHGSRLKSVAHRDTAGMEKLTEAVQLAGKWSTRSMTSRWYPAQ